MCGDLRQATPTLASSDVIMESPVQRYHSMWTLAVALAVRALVPRSRYLKISAGQNALTLGHVQHNVALPRLFDGSASNSEVNNDQ